MKTISLLLVLFNTIFISTIRSGSSSFTEREDFRNEEMDKIGLNIIKSSDDIEVNSQLVKEKFESQGLQNVHPRLFYNEERIAEIKSVVQSDRSFPAKTYSEIITNANKHLNEPIKEWQLDGSNLRVSTAHDVGNNDLPMLALAYLFTKNEQYAEKCYQQMKSMCGWRDWGANRHFLDTGIAARGFAMAYDAIYDYLNAEQRNELIAGLRKHALEPGKLQIETGQGQAWNWYDQTNNWNGICNGGLICAALAVYESDPDFMSQVITLAAKKLEKYVNAFEPDGASEEGMMYWSYGLTNTFLAFEAMERVLGTTFGLTDRNGISKTGWFPYLVSGPVGTATMGDDYLYYGKNNKFLSYFWFAKHYNDADLARKHYDECVSRQAKMNGYHDLLFYYPELVEKGQHTNMPLNGYLKGADYMFLRENNSDDNAIYVGMHGGDNNASHGHLDAGTFNVQANGQCIFVGNLGKPDPYPSDYFDVTNPSYNSAPTTQATKPGRYYYYRVRTEGKSCLVFNPDARPEQDPYGVAVLTAEAHNNGGGYYILDMQDCYSRDVSEYKRGIKLDREKQIVTIQDEFTPITPQSTVYWLAHTLLAESMTLSADKRTATCTVDGKTTTIRIKSPENAEFEIVNRTETDINYLPETYEIFSTIMKGKNPINRWYGKLQIKLIDVNGPTTISVDIGANGIDEIPVVKMESWNSLGVEAQKKTEDLSVFASTQNNMILLNGMEPNDNIHVYNMLGQLMYSACSDTDCYQSSPLNAGVYLIRITRGLKNKILKVNL